MKIWKLILPMLCAAMLGIPARTEDAVKPDAPKTDAPKSADAAKPGETGELPKPPEGIAPLNAAKQTETLTGTLQKGAAPAVKKGMTKAEKKAAKGGIPDPNAISLAVSGNGDAGGKKAKGAKAAKLSKNVALTASGDVLKQLNELADKKANVSVTGSIADNTMTVTSVTETKDDGAKKKKGKKNTV